MALTDQYLSEIVRRILDHGRSYLAAGISRILSDGTRIIQDNNLPTELLSSRSLSASDFGQFYGLTYSFPSSMAALREPGFPRQSRLIPTRVGLKSAPARLVYRIPYGVISSVVEQMAEEYHQEVMKAIDLEISTTTTHG